MDEINPSEAGTIASIALSAPAESRDYAGLPKEERRTFAREFRRIWKTPVWYNVFIVIGAVGWLMQMPDIFFQISNDVTFALRGIGLLLVLFWIIAWLVFIVSYFKSYSAWLKTEKNIIKKKKK